MIPEVMFPMLPLIFMAIIIAIAVKLNSASNKKNQDNTVVGFKTKTQTNLQAQNNMHQAKTQQDNKVFEPTKKSISISHNHSECEEERAITFHNHNECIEERNDHSYKEKQEDLNEDVSISLSEDEVKNAIIWGEILNNPAFKRKR